MKQLYYTLILFGTLALNYKISACVDYHPDSVRVFISGDSLCNLEVRVTNLNMFGGNPNQFCSCGIINSYDVGGEPFFIDYVVFVDSLTNIPVAGFDAFNFLPDASTSWESIDANAFDWSGFVALVNASGIVAGQAVDLVIRGHYEHDQCEVDMEWVLSSKFSVLSNGGFGTDEWNEPENVLALSHNDITYFDLILDYDDIVSAWVSPDYFEFLDNLVLGFFESSISQPKIYPNPATSVVQLQLKGVYTARISDMQGRVMGEFLFNGNNTLDISNFSPGVYSIELNSGTGHSVFRLIKE